MTALAILSAIAIALAALIIRDVMGIDPSNPHDL